MFDYYCYDFKKSADRYLFLKRLIDEFGELTGLDEVCPFDEEDRLYLEDYLEDFLIRNDVFPYIEKDYIYEVRQSKYILDSSYQERCYFTGEEVICRTMDYDEAERVYEDTVKTFEKKKGNLFEGYTEMDEAQFKLLLVIFGEHCFKKEVRAEQDKIKESVMKGKIVFDDVKIYRHLADSDGNLHDTYEHEGFEMIKRMNQELVDSFNKEMHKYDKKTTLKELYKENLIKFYGADRAEEVYANSPWIDDEDD